MTLTSERIQQIIAAVDQGFDEQIAFTRELIRHPSLRGEESSAQEHIYRALSQRGYQMDRWAIEVAEIKDHPGFSPVTVDYDNTINVVATHQPTVETGRSLILNGHVDVVPEGPLAEWQSPPFEPRIDGDWLYGRGSGDMKAGLVANIFALDALRRIGMQPAATVHLQSVTEEECTGNGALSALVRGYRADAAIIPEPTQESLVRGNTGVIWFRVHVKGDPMHALKASKGCNAIEGAIRIIQALKTLEADWNEKKHDLRFYCDHEKPIRFLVGKISGGDWPSSVPAWCSFDVRASLFPGEKAANAAREIEAFINNTCAADPDLSELQPEIEYHGFFAEGYVLEEGSDAEATLVSAHRHSFDQALRAELMPCYLDARVFMLYDDCPTLVYGPFSENIHGFNERVRLSSIKQITRSIALFVAQWCGLETATEQPVAGQSDD